MRTYQLLFLLLICVSFYHLTFSGIVGLKKSLYSRFPRSFYKFSVARENFKFPIEVDHLCIDMNEILHRTVGRRRTLEKSTKLFWSKLDLLISDIAPKKSVIFAFDGPAPFAKLLLQRKRRVFDERAVITPGTELMAEMEYLMLSYLFRRLKRPPYRNLTWFLSSPNEPGEGELKIVDWIRNHMPAATSISPDSLSKYEFTNDTVVLYGGDSDIIVQSLASARYVKDLYVCYIESSSKNKSAILCHIPSLVQAYHTYFHNPSYIRPSPSSRSNESITSYFNTTADSSSKLISSQSMNLICDIMLLTLLNGNDYLKKFRGYSYDKALFMYRNLTLSINSLRNETLQSSVQLFQHPHTFHLLRLSKPLTEPMEPFFDNYSVKYNIYSLYLFFKLFVTPDINSIKFLNSDSQTWMDTEGNRPIESSVELQSSSVEGPVMDVCSPSQVINEFAQKRKFYIEWNVTFDKPASFSTSVTINNVTVAPDFSFGHRKEGRHLCSLLILKLFYNSSYKRLLYYLTKYKFQVCDYDLDNKKYEPLTEEIRQKFSVFFQDPEPPQLEGTDKEKINVTSDDDDEEEEEEIDDDQKDDQFDKMKITQQEDFDNNELRESIPSQLKNHMEITRNENKESMNKVNEEEEEEEGGEEVEDEYEEFYDDDEDEVVVDDSKLTNKMLIERILKRSIKKPLGPCPKESIIHYLRGFLWTLEMYLHGKCLDNSYSFNGQAPTVLEAKQFIENYAIEQAQLLNITSNGKTAVIDNIEILLQHPKIIRQFEYLLTAPKSNYSALSSEMSCISVNPLQCELVVPIHLKPLWRRLYDNLFRQNNLKEISYEILTDQLNKCTREAVQNHTQINSKTVPYKDKQQLQNQYKKLQQLRVFRQTNRLWRMIYSNKYPSSRFRGRFEPYLPSESKLRKLIVPFHSFHEIVHQLSWDIQLKGRVVKNDDLGR